MASIWISAILLFLIKNAASDYDPGVCLIMEESCGLIPPPLPVNFEMKAEHVDHEKKAAVYEEVYFDYANQRAKYVVLVNTTEYHHLFDYNTLQVVEWVRLHPGVSMTRDPLSLVCTATDMDVSPHTYVFGYQQYSDRVPTMFNSNQMLRYGGNYLYAANGTEKLDDRNLNVNKFFGCVFDESTNATLFNKYYFADTNFMEPSGGTPSSLLLTSSDLKPLSVPVKVQVEGLLHKGTEAFTVNKTMSISWFKGKPDFHSDTFLIPPWVNCKDYRGRKEIPKFPTAFSTRLDVTVYKVDSLGELVEQESDTSYEEIYYDAEKKLARRDFTPNPHLDTEIYAKFGSYSPVSTIFDFNEGIMYGINKMSGRCFVRPILENDYFDTEEQLLYRKLATPEELFHMQMDDMEYKGKTFARDVMCDVWNGKHYHEMYDATLIKETYFSTDGWHELADEMEEYGVPIKHLLIKENLDGDLAEAVTAYNFLKFKAKPPVLVAFNINNCLEKTDHKRFAIQLLKADFMDTVFKYRFNFLEAAQLYIANETQVNTPIRVQRLYLRRLSASNPQPFLVFSLLGKANLKDIPFVVAQPGKVLSEAIILLQKLVESGKFSIQFKDPKTNEVIVVPAGVPILYTLTAGGELTPAPRFAEVDVEEADKDESRVIYDNREGMTGGHLTLLAFAMLFIGVGVGIALMYLYLRIYGERLVDDRIGMKTTATNAASASDP